MDRVPDWSRIILVLVGFIFFLILVVKLIRKTKTSQNHEVWDFTLQDLGMLVIYLVVGITCILCFRF